MIGTRRSAPVLLVIGLLTWSSAAAALDDATKQSIRTLANDASADFESGHYQQALEKFQRAYDSAKVPKLAVWLARTQAKLGHLLLARDLYREAMSLPQNELWLGRVQQDAERDAERELSKLEPRIPRLVLQVENADPNEVTLQIDGVAVASSELGVERMVDPGEHLLRASSGERRAEEKVTFVEDERRVVSLRFDAPPTKPVDVPAPATIAAPLADVAPSTGSRARTWSLVSFSVGALGLALGVSSGVMVAIKHGELDKSCPNGQCGPEHWSEVDRYRTWRTLSTVGFVVGAVGAAAGVTLLLVHPKDAEKTQVGFWMAPGCAGLHGSF